MTPLEQQNLKDASASGAIIAAIISVVGAAIIEGSKTAATQPGNPVVVGIDNQTNHIFTIYTFGCPHGHSFLAPAKTLKGKSFVEETFLEAVKGRFKTDTPTKEQIGELKSDWISNRTFEDYAKDCVATSGGTGDGMGYEQVIAIYSDKDWQPLFFLLARRIPGGEYGVGIYATNQPHEKNWKQDDKGKTFIDHIKKAGKGSGTKQTRYSDGGNQIELSFRDVRITISAPGAEIKVTLENA